MSAPRKQDGARSKGAWKPDNIVVGIAANGPDGGAFEELFFEGRADGFSSPLEAVIWLHGELFAASGDNLGQTARLLRQSALWRALALESPNNSSLRALDAMTARVAYLGATPEVVAL